MQNGKQTAIDSVQGKDIQIVAYAFCCFLFTIIALYPNDYSTPKRYWFFIYIVPCSSQEKHIRVQNWKSAVQVLGDKLVNKPPWFCS